MQDPLTPFRVCRVSNSCRDPAINLKAMIDEKSDRLSDPDNAASELLSKLGAYLITREEKYLVVREGMQPTWFVCKRLSPVWVVRNLDAAHSSQDVRDERAFRAGCHEIIRADGSRFTPAKEPEGKPPLATDEWSEAVAAEFGMDAVIEVGRVVHDFARLPKDAHGPFSFPLG